MDGVDACFRSLLCSPVPDMEPVGLSARILAMPCRCIRRLWPSTAWCPVARGVTARPAIPHKNSLCVCRVERAWPARGREPTAGGSGRSRQAPAVGARGAGRGGRMAAARSRQASSPTCGRGREPRRRAAAVAAKPRRQLREGAAPRSRLARLKESKVIGRRCVAAEGYSGRSMPRRCAGSCSYESVFARDSRCDVSRWDSVSLRPSVAIARDYWSPPSIRAARSFLVLSTSPIINRYPAHIIWRQEYPLHITS